VHRRIQRAEHDPPRTPDILHCLRWSEGMVDIIFVCSGVICPSSSVAELAPDSESCPNGVDGFKPASELRELLRIMVRNRDISME
jgi:hypothetical protein